MMMKIKYTEKNSALSNLINGKEYKCVGAEYDRYSVIDETGKPNFYPRDNFEVTEVMRVKYIGNKSSPLNLITDNIYDCIGVEKDWYRIIDETGEDYLYPPEEFEIIK